MADIPFTYFLAAGLCVGYIILLLIALRNHLQVGKLQPWLIGTLILAVLAQAIHNLVPNANEGPYASLFIGGITQPAVAVFLTSLTLIAFTALSLRYLQRRGAMIVVGLGLVWWVALIFASFQVVDAKMLGQAGWLAGIFQAPPNWANDAIWQPFWQGRITIASANVPNVVSAMALGGWLVLGIVTLVMILWSFSLAHLPEISNRILFWILVLPLILIGAVLSTSNIPVLKEIGWVTQFVGMVGVVYAASTYRLLDIRRVLRLTITSGLLTVLTALLILITLLIAHKLNPDTPNVPIVLAVLATLAATLYGPIRTVASSFLNRVFGKTSEDPATIVRRYSQDVSGVVELNELSDVMIDALRLTLHVRRGGLLLATRDDNDTIRLEPMVSSKSEMPPQLRAWIPKESPIYKTLFENRLPLMQYDLEFSRQYADVALELKSFFKRLKMSAYAPIVMQAQLIGILAAGAKVNDDPFYPQDLEVLVTLASQTGISLRNARLVNDLRTASEETRKLNKDITETKNRLVQLDSVKTDFITIASHELRTPLAQIRGYTDILDALNEQRMVDTDQLTGMTNNLRKATDRLEKLIADMLDVSQLGLDAMDLRFAQTTIESVVRLAIEPLAESIKQRKLQLTARGLRDLPAIEADMQRLVQAFRNIVLNAIRYTPDGGRIDISAHKQVNEQTKRDEITVEITDTGIGIDPKNHELIFEKFFRVSDPGLHSTGATKFMGAGPGLGLTIARGVIQGHGGRIWVESAGFDPEKLPGTTVLVLLPVNPPENAKRVLPFEASPAQVVSATSVMLPATAPLPPRPN